MKPAMEVEEDLETTLVATSGETLALSSKLEVISGEASMTIGTKMTDGVILPIKSQQAKAKEESFPHPQAQRLKPAMESQRL